MHVRNRAYTHMRAPTFILLRGEAEGDGRAFVLLELFVHSRNLQAPEPLHKLPRGIPRLGIAYTCV